MAPKNRNRNRNRGAKQVAKAPTQVQQAPIDPKFQRNLGGNQATYIPGLYAPGMPSYREEYGGGGWAGLGKGTSADQLKAKLRSDYAAGRMPGVTASTQAQQEQPQNTRAGFNSAMADGKIGRGKIQSIMDQKGIKGSDQDRARLRITNRLVQKGGTLGIGAAKDYAKAYAARNPQEAMMMSAYGKDYRMGSGEMRRQYEMPSNDMSSRKGQRGALFRGIQGVLDSKDYAKGDVLASLRSGDVRAQPFGTGAGGMGAGGGKKKGKNKRGGGGDTTMGADTGTTAMDQIQPMDMEPMAPEQMAEESSININMPTVADLIGNWASGYRTKRSSRKRAGSKAQGLSSQTVAPTGSWRYGT